MPAQQVFTLATIHHLEAGEFGQEWTDELKALVKDCLAKPAVKKPRELTLKVQIVPKLRDDGTCDDVHVSVSYSSKRPTRPIQTYVMRTTVQGGLKFQPTNPADPDNPGLFE